jgi:hypothetical protein
VSEEREYLQTQLYGIGIFEEEIVLCDFTGPGERRFVVTQEQLMQFFQTEVTFRPFPGLIWMKKNCTSETYLITLPKAERTILYNSGKVSKGEKKTDMTAFKMKFPALAVKIKVDEVGRSVKGIDMWAFTGDTLLPGSKLYGLPLPNLSGPYLCIGGNSFTTDGTDLLEVTEKIIFDTPFNWHHDIVGKEKLPFRDYHKKHRGRCPLKTLEQLGTGRQLLEGKI